MSEKEILVSILVPIYNVEKYLRQCLESLVNQTLKPIEIICINDGSTDRSLEIVNEFAEHDKRIVIIDKENSGYGDSMNQGLKRARGKYIGIVEPDDWVDTSAFEDLCKMAEDNQVEVVRGNYFQNKNGVDMKMRLIPMHETSRVIDPRHHAWVFLMSPAVWAAIYKREFLEKNKINFLPTPGASYQDTSFAFKVWAAAHRAWLTTNAYLHYRIDNENSSVNNPGKIFCVCDEYAEIERFLKENDDFDDLGTVMWIGKASTYYWNSLRLDSKLLNDFLERASAEVKKAVDDGNTYIAYFEDWGKDEPVARFSRALAKGRIRSATRVVRWGRRIGRRNERHIKSKFHPYRTKAHTLERLIADLDAQNELLEQQVRDLRAKMEQNHVEE